MRSLVLQPRARQDIRSAGAWYEAEQPGLGKRFRQAVDECLREVQGNPLMFSVIRHDIRSAHVRRFPYVVDFSVTEDEVVVIGCIHGHRDPRAWQERVE